jgi:uncharacterized protein YbjQ (UPF0145 family)
MRTIACSTLLLTLLTACTTLSPAAEHVRVTANPEAVHGCALLGEVKGADRMWGGAFGQGVAESNAWNELKNRAAAMGADTVLMVTSSTGFSGSRQIGEAYRCAAHVDSAKAAKLAKIPVMSFVRQPTSDGRLVGILEISNDNDVAVMSPLVQCSIGSTTATNVTPLPALGTHQHITTQAISFSTSPFPDGVPTCRVVDAMFP